MSSTRGHTCSKHGDAGFPAQALTLGLLVSMLYHRIDAQALGIWQMLEITTTGREWVCGEREAGILFVRAWFGPHRGCSGLTLSLHWGPYGLLRIEPKLVTCKTGAVITCCIIAVACPYNNFFSPDSRGLKQEAKLHCTPIPNSWRKLSSRSERAVAAVTHQAKSDSLKAVLVGLSRALCIQPEVTLQKLKLYLSTKQRTRFPVLSRVFMCV